MLIQIDERERIGCPLCKSEYDGALLEHFERSVDLRRTTETAPSMAPEGAARTMISERCPECSHEGLFFSTAQLRSADEGQTVFYECPNCGHRFQQNA
jgi:DNA-directed RNA polymerase I subunit RPA12